MAKPAPKPQKAVRRRRKSYAEREYGVTRKELTAFVNRMNAQYNEESKAGLLEPFTGDIGGILTRKPRK
jgi:hypothetical protein